MKYYCTECGERITKEEYTKGKICETCYYELTEEFQDDEEEYLF